MRFALLLRLLLLASLLGALLIPLRTLLFLFPLRALLVLLASLRCALLGLLLRARMVGTILRLLLLRLLSALPGLFALGLGALFRLLLDLARVLPSLLLLCLALLRLSGGGAIRRGRRIALRVREARRPQFTRTQWRRARGRRRTVGRILCTGRGSARPSRRVPFGIAFRCASRRITRAPREILHALHRR